MFANWPHGTLPASVATLLPPASTEPFAAPVAQAILVVLCVGKSIPDEPLCRRFEAMLGADLAAGLDAAALARAMADLHAAGADAAWRTIGH